MPLGVGQVDQVGAVEVQHVEQEHRQRHGSSALLAALSASTSLAARDAVSWKA